MFSNKKRLCFVDDSLLDRSYFDTLRPELFDSDMIHNQVISAIGEIYFAMNHDPTIKSCIKAVKASAIFDMALKFSTIAEKYKDGLQVLHDNTMESLKEACRTVARQIDEEATFRFGLSPGHPYQNAALKATEKNVFGYNDKARLRRDQQLREDFKLRLYQARQSEQRSLDDFTPIAPAPELAQLVENLPTFETPAPTTRARDQTSTYLALPAGLKTGVPKVPTPQVDPVPAADKTDSIIPEELCSKEEAEALKGKVTLSALENVNVENLASHQYVRGFRQNKDGFLDYMSCYECHSITRTGEGANVKYTKTTKIPTDSINMADPRL
jgi:hypothetical protein